MKVKIKKEKGITLIALVVTIVVLLILAAIVIGMLMGENGVIKKAEESKEETTRGKERELIKLAYQNLEMERQTNGIEITTDRIGNKMKEYDEKTKAKGIEEEEIGEK